MRLDSRLDDRAGVVSASKFQSIIGRREKQREKMEDQGANYEVVSIMPLMKVTHKQLDVIKWRGMS